MSRVRPADLNRDRAALTGLMQAYYADVLPKIEALGVTVPDVAEAVQDMWDHVQEYQPPRGQIVVAEDEGGRAVGCGFLRQCAPGSGEMKRLYLDPEERGRGLGRKLVEARIEAARGFGWHSVYADTFRGNDAMLGLYENLGFAPCEAYEGNGNFPQVRAVCVFRRLVL